MTHRVVITGMGAITPIGIGKDEYWQNLLAGTSGVRQVEFPGIQMDQYRTRIAGTVENFDPAQFLPANKKMKYYGRTTLFALAATKMALEDAGFVLRNENNRLIIPGVDPNRIGIILGAAAGNMEILGKEYQLLIRDKGPKKFSPHALPYYLISAVSSSVAMMYDCRGINYVIPTACASASQAIGNGFHRLLNDFEDMIIVGGTDSGIDPLIFGGFVALRVMSTRNNEPERACRPFDLERDGFVMGEGAGIVVLEKLEHALKRHAPIYAEVKGYGMTSDAYHLTIPEPDGRSFIRSIQMALREAGLGPRDIDYINAHGTSTKLNDVVETKALKLAFGKRAYEIPISSTKSMTGHLLGAAGGIELMASVMTIRDSLVHPTINLDFPDPECDLDYVPNKMRKVPVKTALSTSLGFGGFNTALIISKFEA